jgi:hypothetical protein
LSDCPINPKVAALWFVHGRSCANLLRAHGQTRHADNHDAAMDALLDILAGELGRAELAEAIDWVSENMWSDRATNPGTRIEN